LIRFSFNLSSKYFSTANLGDYYCTIKYNMMHIVGSPFKIVVDGDKLADGGGQETTTVSVETVAKISKGGKHVGPIIPIFKSDASKVSSKGMGLKKAYIGKQNQFTLCATDAGEALHWKCCQISRIEENISNLGNNILFIGMYGPKGPCEEVFIKHIGRNNYNINYLVRERGDYILLVKWGDDHIPGSPFKIEA
jgi:filamin